MLRRRLPLEVLVLTAALGCVGDDPNFLVPVNPFSNGPAPLAATPASSTVPPSAESATRVALVGQKVLAANPQMGLRPVFRTIGSPTEEVFHRGTAEVAVTEGLVKKCTTEAQLAAVLGQELGKMAAERGASGGVFHPTERDPAMQMPIGGEATGSRCPADLTYLAELAPYDRERRRLAAAPPDGQALARSMLLKAGYAPADLDAAKPLLEAAAENRTLEKQMSGTPPVLFNLPAGK
jgi:predicted Zn-dependent protease